MSAFSICRPQAQCWIGRLMTWPNGRDLGVAASMPTSSLGGRLSRTECTGVESPPKCRVRVPRRLVAGFCELADGRLRSSKAEPPPYVDHRDASECAQATTPLPAAPPTPRLPVPRVRGSATSHAAVQRALRGARWQRHHTDSGRVGSDRLRPTGAIARTWFCSLSTVVVDCRRRSTRVCEW